MTHDTSDQSSGKKSAPDLSLTSKILKLETLLDVGTAISSVLDINQLTDEILTRLAILIDLRGAFLMLKGDTDGQLETAARSGILDKEILELNLAREGGLYEEILNSGESQIVNDLNALEVPYRHLMLIPLKARDEVVGILGAIDRKNRKTDIVPFSAEDEQLVSAFANQVGNAVSNVRFYKNLQETNQRMTTTLNDLQEAQDHIIHQERMRALGQMASGVVHDVNNAISSIIGYTDLWILFPKMLNDREKILHDLETINRAAQDAAHIIRRLRGFYRTREEGNTILPVNLNHVIPQAIDITRPRWETQSREAGITVHMETDLNTIPNIPGDDADLREMFVNLICNAVDAMTEEGSITFKTSLDETHSGPYVALEVRDTGNGMTEDIRRQCLEPFFSTKGDLGTGMGLAMVFGIIQRHHGTLDIESEPGIGTAFRMRFPVDVSMPSSEIQNADHVLLQPIHALVANDDPIQQLVTKNFLEADGHNVTLASDGREALEQFHRGQFDVVFTDSIMPDMDGNSLARAIKKIAPRKPVIMITGDVDPDGSGDDTVDALLHKPISVEKFRETVAAVITRKWSW